MIICFSLGTEIGRFYCCFCIYEFWIWFKFEIHLKIGDLLFWMKNKKGIFIGFLWCVVFTSLIWAKLTCRLGGNVKNLWVNLQIWFSLLSKTDKIFDSKKKKKIKNDQDTLVYKTKPTRRIDLSFVKADQIHQSKSLIIKSNIQFLLLDSLITIFREDHETEKILRVDIW